MAQISNYDLPQALAEGCCPTLPELLSTRFFKAFCDPSRVGILAQLASAGSATTVSRVGECCPTDLSVVSRHLKTLFDAGIVAAERRGREVHYTVRFAEVARTLRAIADAIEACCPDDAASCCTVTPPPSTEETVATKPSSRTRAPKPKPRAATKAGRASRRKS